MINTGEELLGLKQEQKQGENDDSNYGAMQKLLEVQLDRACLQFRISLLDHTLKGDLFESTAVGFLAALAVDPEKKILRDACNFTTHLSAFVKIS